MKAELKIFNELVDTLLNLEEATPVVKLGSPEELKEVFDIAVQDDSITDTELKSVLEKVVTNTPKTASKSFFNQLYGGRKPAATLGDLLAVMLNTSMYTYKVGGLHVGIEKELVQQVCERVGFPVETSGGTFAAGGSMSNFMAMIMARDAYDAEIKHQGVRKQLVVYTSKEAHHSIAKNASFSGVGKGNIRYIDTNNKGQMDMSKLETAILKDMYDGLHPFFINVTAATTILASFDEINPAANLAEKYGLWLHVDGAYGGSVIFSQKHKHLIKGLERSDSFTMNPHKMLGTPLSCSMIVTKHKQQLLESFTQEASYLYQGDNDDFNLGKTSLQCGRRNDAFKFWCLWKSIGTKGLEKVVDQLFYLADVGREYVRTHSDYKLYSFDESTSVCFNYKGIPADKICNVLASNARLMVAHGTFKEDTFVRFVTVNSRLEKCDIINFFKKFEEFAATADFS